MERYDLMSQCYTFLVKLMLPRGCSKIKAPPELMRKITKFSAVAIFKYYFKFLLSKFTY